MGLLKLLEKERIIWSNAKKILNLSLLKLRIHSVTDKYKIILCFQIYLFKTLVPISLFMIKAELNNEIRVFFNNFRK